MKSSYSPNDVTILLKDISGLLIPLSAEEREHEIQSGTHYSELLPLEYQPSPAYEAAYELALKNYAKDTARAVCHVSELIYQSRGRNVVLISLARAGIPVGILIKHYLEQRYGLTVPHYAVSIIRGRGIDNNAMRFILAHHQPESLQFVDGWTGKGAILHQLEKALQSYSSVSSSLAVLADPANITDLCGTHDDILIPSSCLNCTVSGLISRTVLNKNLIGPDDYHGAVYYDAYTAQDVSYDFIRAVESHFSFDQAAILPRSQFTGLKEIETLAKKYQISDINLLKPGIGETTRVLLRRVPWKVLIRTADKNDPLLLHIYRLAEEKQVPIEYYPLQNYKCCGIIKKLADT
jgi:hypothetical protein